MSQLCAIYLGYYVEFVEEKTSISVISPPSRRVLKGVNTVPDSERLSEALCNVLQKLSPVIKQPAAIRQPRGPERAGWAYKNGATSSRVGSTLNQNFTAYHWLLVPAFKSGFQPNLKFADIFLSYIPHNAVHLPSVSLLPLAVINNNVMKGFSGLKKKKAVQSFALLIV